MAKSFGCKCGERLKPVRHRAWVALTRRIHQQPPRSATAKCLECGKVGRSNAAYVDTLPYTPSWESLAKAQSAHLDKRG